MSAYIWFANEVLTTQVNTIMQFWEVRRFYWYFYYNSSAPCGEIAKQYFLNGWKDQTFGWAIEQPFTQNSLWTGIQWICARWSPYLHVQYRHLSSGLIPNPNNSLFVTIVQWFCLNWNSLSLMSLQILLTVFNDLKILLHLSLFIDRFWLLRRGPVWSSMWVFTLTNL